jgi:hypothetical protein
VVFSKQRLLHTDEAGDQADNQQGGDQNEFRGNDESGFISNQMCQERLHGSGSLREAQAGAVTAAW